MAHTDCHTVHLPLGALPSPCATCGTGTSLLPLPHLPHRLAAEFPELTREEWPRGAFGGCNRPGEATKCSIADDGSRVMRTPYARVFYSLLLSPDFVSFLELLTGIDGIVADSSFRGSGFDQTLPGGSLGIHTDYHYNPRTKLTRRVNVFVYLNENWREEFGGVKKALPHTSLPCPFHTWG